MAPQLPSIARTTRPTTSPIEPAVAVATVLQQGLNLQAGQVMLDYERWEIPSEGLFVVVGYIGPSEQIAARSVLDGDGNETQDLLNRHDVQIDLMSIIPDNSARLRRWEVPMALQSIYARQFCGQYGIGLQPLQSAMTDTTRLEPGGQLNRFTLRAAVFSAESRTLTPAYFDSFSATLGVGQLGGTVEPSKSIPIMEEP